MAPIFILVETAHFHFWLDTLDENCLTFGDSNNNTLDASDSEICGMLAYLGHDLLCPENITHYISV
jgi:hypothetical protein